MSKSRKVSNRHIHRRTRNPDHRTSHKAAGRLALRAPTIRQRVVDYATRHSLGFIDEDLQRMDPDAPESSFRKRRSELTDENIILDSGETRLNSKGQDCVVWLHRSFFASPPPVKIDQGPKPGRFDGMQQEIARLRAALDTAVKVAGEAQQEWDAAPSGMRAGKLLIALAGGLPGYRADIDAIHAARKS